MSLLEKYKSYIQLHHLFQPKDKLLLAVSGGLDSVVLCELSKQAGYDFVIAHCNFHLRGEESDRDEKFVNELGKKYGVEVFEKSFNTNAIAKKEKTSIEETARDLRYSWFHELIAGQTANWILTAHHADDNIETLLMNFFRGTGIKGLHGILPKQGKLLRPLLFARRNELEEYAKQSGLKFVIDHTNAENEYTRNFFRNKVIPLVIERFPEAKENLLKNIGRFGEAEVLYRQAIASHKKKLLEQKGNEVHIPVLKLLKADPLTTIVYEIISDFAFTSHQVNDVIALLQSETGKYVRSASHRIIRNRKWLIIAPNDTAEPQHIWVEEETGNVELTIGNMQIKKFPIANFQLPIADSIAMLDAAEIKFPLLLRKWKQGDYFYPLGMKKKKKISRFLVDQKLSLTQKEKVWVIESNKKIIWVVGMRIDERFKVTDRTKNVIKISLDAS